MKELYTVILAAGKSTRFKGRKSKIFQELAGLPIIVHVYNLAKKTSGKNVIIVCNKNNFKELLKDPFQNGLYHHNTFGWRSKRSSSDYARLIKYIEETE